MNYLSQFRAANPDLQGFSDDQIVEALPQLLPERFGGKPMSQVRAEALLAPEELEARQFEQQTDGRGVLGYARDLGISALKGAISVPEMAVGLADIPTGGRVGQFLENEGGLLGFRPGEAKDILSDLHTDQYKAQQQRFAGADGIMDKTAVAVQNPSLIFNPLVESGPSIIAGGAIGRGLTAATRLGQMGLKGQVAAGAIGEGATMAGLQAEGIRQQTDDGLLTAEQSAIALGTGTLGTLFAIGGGRLAQKLGVGDIDTLVARGLKPSDVAGEIAQMPAKSIPRRVIEGAVTEGLLEELPQSVSEQILQNLALDKEWSEGVDDAVVMGTLAGMVMGGGVGGLSGGATVPRNPVGDANARINAAGDQVAAAGGDALAQESAKAQAASSEIPGAAGEAKALADITRAQQALQADSFASDFIGPNVPRMGDGSFVGPSVPNQFYGPVQRDLTTAELLRRQRDLTRTRINENGYGLMPTDQQVLEASARTAQMPRQRQREAEQAQLNEQRQSLQALAESDMGAQDLANAGAVYRERQRAERAASIMDRAEINQTDEAAPYNIQTITPDEFQQAQTVHRQSLRTRMRDRTPAQIHATQTVEAVRSGRVRVQPGEQSTAKPNLTAGLPTSNAKISSRPFGEGEALSLDIDGGNMSAVVEGDTLHIRNVVIEDPASRGKGIGVALYADAIREAERRGLSHVVSDNSVLPPAARVWESLKRRGLPVSKSPEAIDLDGKGWTVGEPKLINDGEVSYYAVGDDETPVYQLSLREQVRSGQVEVADSAPTAAVEQTVAANTATTEVAAPDLRMRANGEPFASERSAQASAVFRDNRDYASVVPVDGGFAVQIDTQARDQAETQAVESAQARSEQAKRRMFREPDTVNDDMLDAIALMGGIDRAEAEAEGIDPAVFNRRAAGIRPIFTRQNGDSFDGMAERLAQYGYLDPRVDRLDDLRAKLDQAINGNAKIMTPEGYEALAEKEAAAEAQLQQEHEPLADDITSDEAWAGEAYAMAAEAGVPINVIDAILEQYGADPIATLVELNDAINEVNNARAAQAGEGTQGRSADTEIPWNEPGNLSDAEINAIFGEPEQDAEPLLTSYTESDLQAQADAQSAAEQAESDAQRHAEQKAQADAEVNDFTLSGSNRPADVAASRGQNDMFGLGGTPRAEQLAAQQAEPDPQPIESAVDAVDAMNQRINKGEAVTAAEVRRVFEYVAGNQDLVKAELNKLKKDELKRLVSGHVWSDTKKAELVDRAYDSLIGDFRFIGNESGVVTSTGFGAENRLNQAREHVNALTDEQVAEYAKNRKTMIDERMAERKQRIEALKNPQTLQEYRESIRVLGMDKLTPEQRAIYDRLVAEETMAQRQPQSERAGLQTNEQVELGEPTEGTHGKTGETIFNVKVITRLGKEQFKESAAFARSMGGGYYRGNFYFKSREDAELFSGWVNGDNVDLADRNQERQEQKQANAADKLKAMADRIEQQANEALNADRKENTLKRMGEGERARAKASRELSIAAVLKAIPDSDTVVLKNATQKVQIELLDTLARSLVHYAPDEQLNKDNYSRRTFKEDVTPEQQVQHARMPLTAMSVNAIRELANQMLQVKGYVVAARGMLKNMQGRRPDEYVNFNNQKTINKVLEFVEQHSGQYSPLRDAAADYKRLQRMGITSPPLLRTALLEYMTLRDSVAGTDTPNRLQQMERDLQRRVIGNRNAFNDFFPTPEAVAEEVIAQAEIEPGMRVLEPSAGNGMLADAAKAAGAEVDVVEMGGQLREILSEKGYTLVGDDFLEYQAGEQYDRIVMNPPFSKDQDIEHVNHAYDQLKPGGKLVAIVSSMAGDRSNTRNRQFREWLDSLDAVEQPLPQGAFLSSMNQTGVNTKVLVIEKPVSEQDAQPEAAAAQTAPESAQGASNTITANGVTVEVPAIDQDVIDSYNRTTHVFGGRDFNAKLRAEAENLLSELSDRKYTLDTPEQKAEAKDLIEDYLKAEADYYRWSAGQSARNPSWIVTGRGNRNTDRYNRQMEKQGEQERARLDKLQAQRKAIGDTLYRMRPQDVQESQKVGADLREIAKLAGYIANEVREGSNALAAETRKWASPKAHKLIERSLSADPERVTMRLRELDAQDPVQEVGGLVSLFGPRSKAGKLVKELLDDSTPKFSRRVPQTDTASFRNWFGDSKVVDENGEPLVVYHGTGADFTSFSNERKAGGQLGDGFYFAPTTAGANMFAKIRKMRDANSNPVVIPAYLSIQNPYIIEGREAIPISGINVELLENMGHDGVIVMEGGQINEITAFNPEQIKSAIGNNGNFDPNNPDIRFSPRNEVTSENTATEGNTNEGIDQLNEALQKAGETATARRAVLDALTGGKRQAAEFAEALASTFGQTITWVQTDTALFDGVTVNGQLFVDIDSSVPYHIVMGHELTHILRNEHPDLYAEIEALILPEATERAGSAAFHRYAEGSAKANEEYVADVVGNRFGERQFWADMAATEPNLFRRVAAIVRSLIQRVTAQFKSDRTLYGDAVKDLNKVRNQVAGVMMEYRRRQKAMSKQEFRQSQTGDLRFSLRDRMRRGGDAETGAFAVPEETWANVALRKMADKFQVLKDLQKNIQDAGGTVNESNDAYLAEELFHGKTEEDLRQMRETFIKPLADKMAKFGIEQKDLDQYLYAKHAPERNAHIAEINPELQEAGSGMSDAKAAEIIQQARDSGKLEQYEQLAGMVYDMLETRRETMRSAGLEEDGMIDAWESKYEFYVPLKGWAVDEQQDSMARTGKGFNIAGKESKRAMGRSSEAASPSSYAIQDLTETLIRRRKNEVGNALLNLVQDNPNKGYWQVFTNESPDMDRQVFRSETEASKQARAAARKAGQPEPDRQYQETVRETPIPMAMMSDKYFQTKRDGKTYFIKLEDERLMKAMKNIGPDTSNFLIRKLGAVNRVLSSLNTSYNPEFVVGNFARDVQTAVLNLMAEQSRDDGKALGEKIAKQTVKDIPKAMKAVYRGLRNKDEAAGGEWQKWFTEFREAGAKTGWFDMKDIDGQADDLQSLISMAKGGVKGNAMKWFKATGQMVEDLNGAVENAVRLSAYVNARKAGISEAKAASLAKNMTVNFNRRGEVGTTLNALYMFANASIQGSMNFARTMVGLKGEKGDPIWQRLNTAQKVAAGLVMGSFAIAMMNRAGAGEDDDGENWYDKVPDYVKERNLVIMKSLLGGDQDGSYWTIPLPYGYNIFHVLGNALEGTTNGNTSIGKAATDLTLATLGSFSPIGFQESQSLTGTVVRNITPTLGKPLVDIGFNENFMGTSIYNENFPFGTPRPDSQLGRRATPEGYKAITEFLNDVSGGSQWRSGYIDINPDVMRYMANYFTGAAGKFLFDKAPNNAYHLATLTPIEARETLFISRVSGRVLPYADREKFYSRRDEIGQIEAEWKGLRGADRMSFYRDNRSLIRLKPLIKSSEKQLKALRQQRDRIYALDLPRKQQEARMEVIDARMKRVIDRFNREYAKATGGD